MSSIVSVDLVKAAKKSFDIPDEYTDEGLKSAAERYERFLKLAQKHRGKGLVPSKDIDMMWHLHMLHPKKYCEDCDALFGEILDHNGGFGLEAEEEDDHARFSRLTADLWHQEYGEEYITGGRLDAAAQCRRACTESCSTKCR